MGGFITLSDGRNYAAASWAYDATIRAISAALPATDEGKALSTWLLDQQNSEKGPGMGSVDIRELTPGCQILFTQAVRDSFATCQKEGPVDWASLDFFPEWLGRFSDLLQMIESIERGEPPEAFNPHMRNNHISPPTEAQAGPGWDNQ